jgi:hypothetical protein
MKVIAEINGCRGIINVDEEVVKKRILLYAN